MTSATGSSCGGAESAGSGREFGLARKTVRKMLEYPVPPGYQRQKPVRRPKLGPWQAPSTPFWKRTRAGHEAAAHREADLRAITEEHGYTGGYTIVKDYVRQSKIGAPGDVRAAESRAR